MYFENCKYILGRKKIKRDSLYCLHLPFLRKYEVVFLIGVYSWMFVSEIDVYLLYHISFPITEKKKSALQIDSHLS